MPNASEIIAATIWLRVNADARQPNDRKKPPARKMPTYIPPSVPKSNAFVWLVKRLTIKRQTSKGSHITT